MYGYPFQQFGKTEQLIRVTGIDGAKAYQMMPNSTVVLFDGGEDLFYLKSTDGAGFPTIRVFRFEEIKEQATQTTDFLTRAEFEQFRKELLDGKQHIPEA